MTGFATWTWVTIAGALSFGVLLALAGSIKAALARRLGIDEKQAGGLLAWFNVGLIPMMLIGGLLVDSWGAREVLILGSALAAVGLFSISLSTSVRHALCAVLLTGVGAGCVGNSATVLMPRALFENSPAASLNLGYIFFGLGALLTPVAVELMLRVSSLRRTLGAVSICLLVPALLTVIAPGDLPAVSEGRGPVWTSPMVWLAAVLFMLYGPLEAWLGTSASRYLEDLGYSPRRALLLMGIVWLVFLGSRLCVALLQQRELLAPHSDSWLIWMLALLASVALGNLAGTHSKGNAAVALLLTGSFLGPLFPTLAGFVLKSVDAAQQGTAFGAMYATGAAAGLALAPLFAPTRPVALRVPLYLLIGIALALVGTGLALALTQ